MNEPYEVDASVVYGIVGYIAYVFSPSMLNHIYRCKTLSTPSVMQASPRPSLLRELVSVIYALQCNINSDILASLDWSSLFVKHRVLDAFILNFVSAWVSSGNAAAFAALTDPLNNTIIGAYSPGI
jgi:hypothetical protein